MACCVRQGLIVGVFLALVTPTLAFDKVSCLANADCLPDGRVYFTNRYSFPAVTFGRIKFSGAKRAKLFRVGVMLELRNQTDLDELPTGFEDSPLDDLEPGGDQCKTEEEPNSVAPPCLCELPSELTTCGYCKSVEHPDPRSITRDPCYCADDQLGDSRRLPRLEFHTITDIGVARNPQNCSETAAFCIDIDNVTELGDGQFSLDLDNAMVQGMLTQLVTRRFGGLVEEYTMVVEEETATGREVDGARASSLDVLLRGRFSGPNVKGERTITFSFSSRAGTKLLDTMCQQSLP
jgi:hypothetical protein